MPKDGDEGGLLWMEGVDLIIVDFSCANGVGGEFVIEGCEVLLSGGGKYKETLDARRLNFRGIDDRNAVGTASGLLKLRQNFCRVPRTGVIAKLVV